MVEEHVHVTETSGGNSMGFLLGIILLIVFFLALFYYGLPYLRGNSGTTGGTPQINVPNKFDVNVKQQK